MSYVSAARRRGTIRDAAAKVVEEIESRILFAFTVTHPIADFSVSPGTPSSSLDLTNVIDDSDIPGTVVRFDTSLGNVDLALFDSDKPATVANFLSYVNSGTYNGTFIHGAQNKTDSNPAFVPASDAILGGGYSFPGFLHVATTAPVADETTTNGVKSNLRGTIAMSKSGAPNTATSDWFINTGDNPALDSTAQDGGYTVFGNVIDNTMTTVDAINALPRYDFSAPFSELPLRNYTEEDYEAATQFDDSNLVIINNATVIPKVTYSVSSSNPSLVSPSVDGNTLDFTYGAGNGTAAITLTGTGVDGSTTTDTFNVGVGTLDVTIGTGGAKGVTFDDGDGTAGTITLKGGSASVSFSGSGLTQTTTKKGVTVTGAVGSLATITLNGTNGSSTLSVKARGGNGVIDIAGISASGGVKSIAGKQIAASGNVNLASASQVTLASLTNGTLSIGGATPVSVTVGGIQDSSLNITAPIKSFKAANFGGSGVQLTAGSISKMTFNGDFNGGLTASALSSFKAGSITGSDILVNGPIGKVSANGITGSTIFSNVATQTLPASIADVTPGGSIASVSNKGAFADSSIAALLLGKISLGTITTANGGTPFGVAGDTITSLTATDTSRERIKFSRLTTASQSFNRGDFVARLF